MRNTRTKEQLERLRLRDRTGGVQEEQREGGGKLEEAMTKGISLSLLCYYVIGMLMRLLTGKLLTTPSRLFKLLIPLSTGIQGEHKGVFFFEFDLMW